MTQIKDAARIIRKGRVTSAKALLDIAKPVTFTCGASTCSEVVTKDGNFCSMTCALTPAPVVVEPVVVEEPMTDVERFFRDCERMDWFYGFSDDGAVWRRGQDQMDALVRHAATDPTLQAVFDLWRAWTRNPADKRPTLADLTPKEAPVTDHVAPCKDMLNGCIDLECQVRKALRQHLLLNVAEKDRPAWSQASLTVLERLLNDEQYGTQTPEFFLEATLEGAACIVGQTKEPVHVQAPKAALTTTTKAVRKPRTAKTPPRITDGQEHPVTTKITMTKDEMEAAISRAVDARIAEREAAIKAAPRVAPADKPVEVVTKKGGRAKIERATAKEREFAGVTLPAFLVGDLEVPALEVGEESIDTLVSAAVRRPYNKARFRLDATPVALDKDTTTYRTLVAEHERLMALAVAKRAAKPAKAKKAKKEAAPKVAAVVDVQRLAKVAALVTTLGMTRDEAEALVG